MVDLADFRAPPQQIGISESWPPIRERVAARRQEPDRPSRLFDYFGAGLITLSVAFGPALMWLLAR